MNRSTVTDAMGAAIGTPIGQAVITIAKIVEAITPRVEKDGFYPIKVIIPINIGVFCLGIGPATALALADRLGLYKCAKSAWRRLNSDLTPMMR